jgi:imidazolonepropionase-like amidohydrolase
MTACQPQSTTTAITNVTVIDAITGVRTNRTVVFSGDEITRVTAADVPAGAEQTIDGTGKFLIPGLWDFHVHFTYDDRLTDSMPALFLSYGITSVRDTGGLMNRILPVVEKMRAEGAVAPRIFFAGPLLDGDVVVYDGNSGPALGIRNATPEQARETITQLGTQGVDFIKIYEMVSPAVFESMVETANELNLPIDSHVPLSMRARVAGPSVNSIEHLRNIEMDCTDNAAEFLEARRARLANPEGLSGAELRASLHAQQRMRAVQTYDEQTCDETLAALHSTMQVPTLRIVALELAPPYRRDDWEEALSRIPPDVREEWRASARQMTEDQSPEAIAFSEWALRLTGRMHSQSIPIGAGTDTPIRLSVPGYSLHSELEYLVRAGLTPLEALESATLRPAEYFSLQDEMGAVAIGQKADLVLLNANPLENIANTRNIHGVVSKGHYHDVGSLLSRDTAAAVPAESVD